MHTPPASAQTIERLARAAGVVPAGCWGSAIEQVICFANHRARTGNTSREQSRIKVTQAQAAYVRIVEWHEINAVMPFCKPDPRGSCYQNDKSGNMITLDAAQKLLSLCKNSNQLACNTLMRRAPNRR